MAVVTVAFEDLDTWLQNQPANTADTPYELNITGLTISDIGESTARGTLGKIINSNNTKYVDLSPTLIPNGVTNMYYAFSYCGTLVEPPVIPNGVTNMEGCFYNCPSLVNAPVIPNGVTNMKGCFGYCSSLVNATIIPNSVTDITHCFSWCQSLINAPVISDSITNMVKVFYNCPSLVNAPVIPNSVTDLSACFWGCTALAYKPIIPSSVTSSLNCYDNVTQTKWGASASQIDSWVALQTTEFEVVEIEADTENNCYEMTDREVYGIDITNLSTWLSEMPINDVPNAYKIKILSLTTNNAGDIKDILSPVSSRIVDLGYTIIPEGTDCVKLFSYNDGVGKYVDNLCVPPVMPTDCTDMSYTFKRCRCLRTPPVIPSGVTTIDGCFHNTDLRVPPVIPNGVTSMVKAFYGCHELGGIPAIPSSVINMQEAFYEAGRTNWDKLGTAVVNLPNGVLNINNAFSYCYLLKEVECIPSSVTTATQAFNDCFCLKKIDRLELPLSTLDSANFQNMFLKCTSLTEIGYKVNESDQWHAFRLKVNADSVEGEIYDTNVNVTYINEGQAVSITKSSLNLPVKTDELWFPNMADPNFNTDAKIDAVIEKVLQNKYSYFKKTALPPNEKSFVLWADDPNNVVSNILDSKVTITSSCSLSINKDTRAIISGENITLTLPATGSTNGSILELFTTNDTSIVYYADSNTSATQTMEADSRILFVYYNGWRFVGTYGAVWN